MEEKTDPLLPRRLFDLQHCAGAVRRDGDERSSGWDLIFDLWSNLGRGSWQWECHSMAFTSSSLEATHTRSATIVRFCRYSGEDFGAFVDRKTSEKLKELALVSPERVREARLGENLASFSELSQMLHEHAIRELTEEGVQHGGVSVRSHLRHGYPVGVRV